MQTKTSDDTTTQGDNEETEKIDELGEIIADYQAFKRFFLWEDDSIVLKSILGFIIPLSIFSLILLSIPQELQEIFVIFSLFTLILPVFYLLNKIRAKNTIEITVIKMIEYFQEKQKILKKKTWTVQVMEKYQEINRISQNIQEIYLLQTSSLKTLKHLRKNWFWENPYQRFYIAYIGGIHYMHREILSLYDELRSLMKQSVSEIQWAVDDIRALEGNSSPDAKIGQLLEVRLTEQEKQFEVLLKKTKNMIQEK